MNDHANDRTAIYREFGIIGLITAASLALQAAIPSGLVWLPEYIVALAFIAIGVHRWRRWRTNAGLLFRACALIGVTVTSIVVSELGLDVASSYVDIVGAIVIIAITTHIAQVDAFSLDTITKLLASVSISSLVIWSLVGTTVRHAAGLAYTIGWTLSGSAAYAAFALGVGVLRRSSLGIAAFLGSLGAMAIGETLYYLDAADVARLPERVLLAPYTASYAIAIVLFMPVTSRQILRRRQPRTDPWNARTIQYATGLGVAVVVAVSAAHGDHTDTAIRAALGALATAATIWRIALVARTERSADQIAIRSATFDATTGLPNVASAVSQWAVQPPPQPDQFSFAYAIAVTNLDDIEVSFGTSTRAAVTAVVASRVGAALRSGMILAANPDGKLVAFGHSSPTDAWRNADLLNRAVSMQTSLPEGTFTPVCSIGFASNPANDVSDASRRAMRTALLLASRGEHSAANADAVDNVLVVQDIDTVDQATRAVRTGAISTSISEITSIATGTTTGAWVTSTWSAAGRRFSISDIDHLLVGADSMLAFSQSLAAALQHLPATGPVFIETSPRHLTAPTFVDLITEATRRAGASPDRLAVMLHERAFDTSCEPLALAIEAAAALGVRIGIAHFGEAHLGISRMRGFPISYVSVADGVAARVSQSSARRLISALTGVGDALQFEVLAPLFSHDSRKALKAAKVDHVIMMRAAVAQPS